MQGELGIEPAFYSSLGNFSLLFGRTYHNPFAFGGDFYLLVNVGFRIIGEMLRDGYFPLWDPSQASGEGGIGIPLIGASYPLSIFCTSLGHPLGIIIYYLIHFELMGIFSYLAFRRLGIRPASSLLISGWNAMSGYTVYIGSIPSVIAPLPWFFLIIYILARTDMFYQRYFLARGLCGLFRRSFSYFILVFIRAEEFLKGFGSDFFWFASCHGFF